MLILVMDGHIYLSLYSDILANASVQGLVMSYSLVQLIQQTPMYTAAHLNLCMSCLL